MKTKKQTQIVKVEGRYPSTDKNHQTHIKCQSYKFPNKTEFVEIKIVNIQKKVNLFFNPYYTKRTEKCPHGFNTKRCMAKTSTYYYWMV